MYVLPQSTLLLFADIPEFYDLNFGFLTRFLLYNYNRIVFTRLPPDMEASTSTLLFGVIVFECSDEFSVKVHYCET